MLPTLKERWNKLLQDLKPMTFKQKADHLFTYYYWVLIVLAIVLMIVAIIISSVKNLRTEVLISGALVNANVGLEGHTFLQEAYFQKLGGNEKDQAIRIANVQFEDPSTTQEIEYTYNATMQIVAMVNAKELDYMIMNTIGLEFYLGHDIFFDLREILPQEDLERLKDDLIYMTYEDTGETIPVAINLKNTAFGQKYVTGDKDHYISFVVNSLRPDACKLFWEYIKTGE